MQKIIIIVSVFCFFLIAWTSENQQNNSTALKGPYLGQNPPGLTPEIFAPGIISSKADEGCSSFSKDGQVYFFARAKSPTSGIFVR